jgi:alpha-D-ribose 1-methylphosphonate 5-triphosphate diphosphatase
MLDIRGGSVLVDGQLALARVLAGPDGLSIDRGDGHLARIFDATDLFVLPGIVDIHGDAFERQIMPRPNVMFDLDIALLETDRQLTANGITTAYHGVTSSWEPGLRSTQSAANIIEAILRLKPQLMADTRVHLRQETYHLDAEPQILEWLAAGMLDCVAFNDHTTGTILVRNRPDKVAKMVQRTGLSHEAFDALVERVAARKAEVMPSLQRLAAASNAHRVALLSHDDMNPAMRAEFRMMGASIAEFPINEETAQAAKTGGDHIVFGGPNVLRGGSHTGCPSASAMVAEGLCTILASDYFYPSLAAAPFKLAAEGNCDIAKAWSLVSEGPAQALGLSDRGRIADNLRADIVLVAAQEGRLPRIVATIVNGRLVYLTEPERLH